MENIPHDLGVFATDKQVFLYSQALLKGNILHLGISSDGLRFKPSRKTPTLYINKDKKEDTRFLSDFRITLSEKKFILFYKQWVGDKAQTNLAFSKDGVHWERKHTFFPISSVAMVVPETIIHKQHVVFYGEEDIRIAYTYDFVNFRLQQSPALAPREKYFDNHPLSVASVIHTKKGLLVLYYVRKRQREHDVYSVGAALFDKKDPTRVLWRSSRPLWEQGSEWKEKVAYPMGAVHFQQQLILYFGVEGDAVYAINLGKLLDIINYKVAHSVPQLKKHTNNPIIKPVLKHVWERDAVFNSAAIYEDGKVHFVYRAMGPHNTSVLGYASSSDGFTIDERLPQPIYYPTEPFEVPVGLPSINYMSGGGYGGCEDPRLTKIDDMLYMTYVAYNGYDAPKVALTSITLKDFLAKNWIWAKPKIISGPHVVNKNCVIFPEKINGKYFVMHRIFPDILIDKLDDLSFDNKHLVGHYSISPREDSWDSRKLGAGAPPIKTKDGWLLIYQAVDDKDPGKYKIGAMLLDLNDPAKVLYRPHAPILSPTEWYENEGFKAGVTYPCGAVVKDEELLVYYGGADTVICAASAPLDSFLKELKKSTRKDHVYKPLLEKVQQPYMRTNRLFLTKN